MERNAQKALIVVTAAVLAASTPSFGGVIYYSAESPAGFSHLYSFDTDSGVSSDRGLIHGRKYTTDLAIRPDGSLFGVGWHNAWAGGSSKLYQIIPGDEDHWADWAMETVKCNGMDRAVNSAIFDAEGNLFVASDSGTFQKLVYDSGHDRWNVVRSGHLHRPAGGDLAFGPDGLTLYAALRGGDLASVDFDADSPTFGRCSAIGATGYSDVYGLATVEGVLYGTTADGNYGASRLVRIDTTSGQATLLGDLGAGVWGAAADPSLAEIPEPMTLAFITAGLLAVTVRRTRRQPL